MKNKKVEEEEDEEQEDQEEEEDDEEVQELDDDEDDEDEDGGEDGEGDEDEDEDQDDEDVEGLDDEDDDDDGGEPKTKKAKIDITGAVESFEHELSRIKSNETALGSVNTIVSDICTTISENDDCMKSVEALSKVSKAFVNLCKHVKSEEKNWKLFDGTANKNLETVAQIIIETFEDVLDNCNDELFEEDAYRSAQITLEEMVKEPYMAVIITGMSEYNELWDNVEAKIDEFNDLAENEDNEKGDDNDEDENEGNYDEDEEEDDDEDEDANDDDEDDE